ncbi:sulfotransferase family protein [Marinicella sp. S1101]|uniref:sulfotransferase family protein n=1 Tax=Marinicella marina TaxID=2996016 RepID=UPI002260EC15|nr:sulfotransferase family protein [Marinicella marina]MCX7555181.1 sulfotransferase family protein [Marinicella marina]MDJ1140007.1 sulfotransferase [Marinicella marina]
MNKLFIIGLPRTGTTSICAALLDEGFKVAHTAFSKHSFVLADAIADTPCYCDYPQLDALFPESKFVYLERNIDDWLPSIKMMLSKLIPHLQKKAKFNPTLNRCYEQTFALSQTHNPLSDEHLIQCYENHQQQVRRYFKHRNDQLKINVSDADSFQRLIHFVNHDGSKNKSFPHLNQGRMVTGWKDIKHPNKVNSDAFGPERRKFFDYEKKFNSN